MTPDEAERILDLARAEARSWGSPRAGLAHVASVMRSLHPAAFESRFGYTGGDVVEGLLRTSSASTGARAAREIVTSALDVDDLLERLHDELLLPEVLVRGAEMADRERWIVRHIEDRLRHYARHKNSLTHDELYVLVGALKVLGFEDSYRAMRARITD